MMSTSNSTNPPRRILWQWMIVETVFGRRWMLVPVTVVR